MTRVLGIGLRYSMSRPRSRIRLRLRGHHAQRCLHNRRPLGHDRSAVHQLNQAMRAFPAAAERPGIRPRAYPGRRASMRTRLNSRDKRGSPQRRAAGYSRSSGCQVTARFWILLWELRKLMRWKSTESKGTEDRVQQKRLPSQSLARIGIRRFDRSFMISDDASAACRSAAVTPFA